MYSSSTTRKLIAFGTVSLAGASAALATSDYGPAVSRMITGCTKWYTSGNGHRFCVVHDMEGYYLSSISYMQRCDVSVSVHYAANGLKDSGSDAAAGEISQLVSESNYAWHAGCWNRYSIACEHEGFVSNPAWFTEAMYQSSALLFRHFCDKFGIPKDRNHVVGHNAKSVSGWPAWASANLGIDPYCNSHTDPGQYWNWSHYMALITGGTDDANFVSKSVANGANFSPGQAFTCNYTMNNSGTTTWIANGGSGYTLNYSSGTQMGAPNATAISGNVGPGGNATIGVNFTAPATPGSYTVVMRMNSSANAFFGDSVSLQINVVNPAPVINTQPADVTKSAGQTATFTVSASGATSYQWKKNGVNIGNGGNVSGATSATLSIANAQLSDAAFYTVVVANAGGSVASDQAQLVISSTASAAGNGTGLRGLYYNNQNFSSLRVSRIDGTINFDWGAGAPAGGVGVDQFAVRWTGQVQPRYTQTYTFYTTTDDGVRLWVNGTLIIDHWADQGATEWSGSIALTAGQKYDIRMDYYENTGGAAAQLRWSSPSLMKEIVPAAQLYRPPTVLAAISDRTVNQGAAVTLNASLSSSDSVGAVTPFEDFESFPDVSASDIIMFRKPGNSASTSSFLDGGVTNYAYTAASMPAGNSSTRALHASWSFLTGTSNPWLRLTTANTASDPNPVIAINQSLWFDVYADKAIKVAVGVRETSPAGAIGSNGGTTGTIEFVGAPDKSGAAPNPTHSVGAGAWTTVKVNLPADPLVGFTGNGVLDSSTGKGVLENLAIVPNGGMGVYNVYLDNFLQVQNPAITYSLDPGAPAGATIDPDSGAFAWTPGPGQSGQYTITVRATDTGSPSTSDTEPFVVTVNSAPSITSQPGGQTVAPGANVPFSVGVSGSAPLTFQWRFNGDPIAGATASTYTRSNVQSSDGGDYSVVVSNSLGWAMSSNATLVVSVSDSPPSITTQPVDRTVNQNANANFSVAVVGTVPLAYQWYFEGGEISGATGSSYTRTSAQSAHEGGYSVIITNDFGSATSVVASLTVILLPSITTQPVGQTVNQGSNATFSAVATGTPTLTYQWRKGGTNIAGATGTSYTRNGVVASDAATYSVVVSNTAGYAISSNAVLAVNLPPTINTPPTGQSVNAGANVTLTVGASGTAPLGYQWRKNGAPIAGATTSSYALNNVQAASVGLYSVVVSNFLGTATSADASVELNAVVVFSDDFEAGNLNNWTTAASPATALANSTAQNHTSAGSHSALEDITTDKMYHNLGLELQGHARLIFYGYDDTANNVNSGQTRWFGEVRGYTGAGYADGGVETVFAIGRYGVGFGTGTGSLATQVVNTTNYAARVVGGANTGWLNLGVQRSVGWHKFEIDRSADGGTVTFYVDGVLGATVTGANVTTWDSAALGSIATGSTAGNAYFDDLIVQYYDPPTILSASANQTVAVGGTANFSVSATNNAMTYQWRRNGTALSNGGNVSGATSPSLTVTGVQGADAGVYTVVVANGAGAVSSAGASLLVPPMITVGPAGQTNMAGTTASFSVTVAGQATMSYVWKKGGVSLTDGGNVSGSHTANLVLTGVGDLDEASYSVAVTNAAGGIVSGAAPLVIVHLPSISLHPVSQSVAAGVNVTFTGGATGTAPLNYQWTFNGSPIPGATGTSYTRNNVQDPDSGSYVLTVTNAAGGDASDPAVLSINTAPSLSAIASLTIHAGAAVHLTPAATDPEAPPQVLNYSLDSAPSGAAIVPGTGAFSWTSAAADAGTTNTVTLRVTDNGSPVQSATTSFSIRVVDAPMIASVVITGETLTLSWPSIPGQNYRIQSKLNLDDPTWDDVTDVQATGETTSIIDGVTDELGLIPQRFYRIVALDQ